MDCFISHHKPLIKIYKSIFTFLRLKKATRTALLSTANFKQVIIISYFANFEQLIRQFANFEHVIIKIS